MRHFSYYLFENFDPEVEAKNPENPRNFLTCRADPILSQVAQHPPLTCPADTFSPEELILFIRGGILRMQDGVLAFDTPIFLREDAPLLQQSMREKAVRLVDLLHPILPEIRRLCSGIPNWFPVEENLYHILCGMVFDGLFFDFLSRHNAVATSRVHPSGLDYLSVLYDDCPELNHFSDGLLCSYNRFTNGHTSLQSFGDADGNRFDFYRFSRQIETDTLPEKFASIRSRFQSCPGKDWLLHQTQELYSTGSCDPEALELLTLFGYAKCRRLCVPVFTNADRERILKIEELVEKTIGDAFLSTLSHIPDITALRHGVPPKEIANELYHILFGSVNEALVSQKIVAAPPHIPGEGRYLRCIELDL